MKARLAILCPGQGGQQRNMLDLARSEPRVAAVVQSWQLEAALGMPVARALEQEEHLFANRIAQPLVVAAALAGWEALKHALPAPTLVAGYSIGELAAYAVAGAVSSGEAIRLAGLRAQLMDACVKTSARQGLLAISGIRPGLIAASLAKHGLYIAIETSEDSFIAGGLLEAIHAFKNEISGTAARLVLLPVDVASHTPLMRGAASAFMEVLNRSQLQDPQIAVLSGIAAQKIVRREQAIFALGRQLEEKIRWADCMDACAEAGITVALELGPGAALSRMLQARHPQIESRSLTDFRSYAGVVKWVERCSA